MRRNGLAQTEQETIDSTANELKALFQKRGKLIIELKNHFQNRANSKKSISEINKEIRESKQLAFNLSKDLKGGGKNRREIITQLKQIREKLKAIKSEHGNPSMKIRNAKKQIAQLEWNLQTSRISKEEEKKIVIMIAGHESDVRKFEKLEAANVEAVEIRKETNRLESELSEIDVLRENVIPHLESVREKIFEKEEGRDKLSDAISETDSKILKVQESLTEIQDKIFTIKKKRSDMFNIVNSNRGEIIRQQDLKILEEKKKQALEKLEDGQKLTFDEWMLTAK